MADQENVLRSLAFADDFISAILVDSVRDFAVEDGVVVNLSPKPMVTLGSAVAGIVPAWKSTVLMDAKIVSAERAAVLNMTKITNLGGVGLRGWDWLGNRIKSFPRDTPLYISAQDTIGTMTTDPLAFTNENPAGDDNQEFVLKLNLWWAPSETDCYIHNEHPFLEVHTQIHGLGRMQKFYERKESTMFEDVMMPVGYTHDPFCRVAGKSQWEYPWHRYYADTDSIWLAIELHPTS